jgi:hypothetical protein
MEFYINFWLAKVAWREMRELAVANPLGSAYDQQGGT